MVTALGCTVLGFSAQLWAQKHTSANHAAILFTLEPVFAALTSYVVLHERLSSRTLAGAALIFAAILLAELKGPAPAPMDSTGPVADHVEMPRGAFDVGGASGVNVKNAGSAAGSYAGLGAYFWLANFVRKKSPAFQCGRSVSCASFVAMAKSARANFAPASKFSFCFMSSCGV